MYTTLAPFHPSQAASYFSLFGSDPKAIEVKLDKAVDAMFHRPGSVTIGNVALMFPRFSSAIFSSCHPKMPPAVRQSAISCLRSFVVGAGIRSVALKLLKSCISCLITIPLWTTH